MKIPPKFRRLALYAAISVLAYFGPEIYNTENSAPYADMKANGFPRVVLTEVKVATTEWKTAFKLKENIEALESEPTKMDLTEKSKEAIEKYLTEKVQAGPLTLGGAIRNMALSAFVQTVCYLTGTVGGMFNSELSEHWATASIATFLHVPTIYAQKVPVQIAEYFGKWTGWWLFLLFLSLPYRFVKFWRGIPVHSSSANGG
jgi:hypothetical protein